MKRKIRRTTLGHIQWKNTTTIPTPLIAKWVRRSCQRWAQLLEIPADWTKTSLGTFKALNRGDDLTSGHASLFSRETVVSFSTTGQGSDEFRRWRRFFNVVAHEIGHMAVAYSEKTLGRLKSRNNGTGWGGDEEYICRIAKKFEDEVRDAEVYEWMKEAGAINPSFRCWDRG